jgi:hypothetical protein
MEESTYADDGGLTEPLECASDLRALADLARDNSCGSETGSLLLSVQAGFSGRTTGDATESLAGVMAPEVPLLVCTDDVVETSPLAAWA